VLGSCFCALVEVVEMSSPYNYKWQRFRAGKLAREPLCVWCLELGKTEAATEVHHVIPLRDRPDLKLSDANTVSLCKACHDGPAQHEERTGHKRGCSVDGIPLDTNHPWRQLT